MKLSIIICVYNTNEKYLDECISSIRNSTLSDYEIIFVDDGSTVNYTEFLGKHELRYIKTENKGLLSARCTGVKLALGDYIAFVDSDDLVSKNYHLPMICAAESEGADIVLNGWAFHTERTKRCCTGDVTMTKTLNLTNENALSYYLENCGRDHSLFVQWNKVFLRDLLICVSDELESIGALSTGLTYGEDVCFNFFTFKHARKIININSGFYFYRIHDEQSVVFSDERKLTWQIVQMSSVFNIMSATLTSENKNSEQMHKNINSWRALMARTHYSAAKSMGAKSLGAYIKKEYGVKRLGSSKISDSAVYIKCELLGDNFSQIDTALSELFFKKGRVAVSYDRRSRYQRRIIGSLAKIGDAEIVYAKKNADLEIPSPKVKIKDRILHNSLLRRVGMLIFKKGSKMRRILKRRL